MEKNRFKIVFFLLLFFQLKIIRAGDYIKSDCLLFDFYTSKWVNSPNEITTNPTVNFSFSYGKDFLIKSSNFSWFYGLGYDFSAMNHSINFKSIPLTSGMSKDVGIRILNVPYSINKLRLQFLEVPLEFRYYFGDKENSANRFFIGIGIDLGLRLDSFTKLKYTKNNKSIVNISKNDFGLSKYRYSTSVTFGNDNFNLFIKYFLSDFFQSNSNPEFISNKPILLKTGFSFSLF